MQNLMPPGPADPLVPPTKPYSTWRTVLRVVGLALTLIVGLTVAFAGNSLLAVVAALVLLQVTLTAEVLLRGLEFEEWARATNRALLALDPANYLGETSRRYLRVVRDVSKRRTSDPDVGRRFESLMGEMEELAHGRTNFKTLDEAFRYKANRLDKMNPEDGAFRSTVIRADLEGADPAYTRASFGHYRNAMKRAAQRGVPTKRIYLLDEWDQIDPLFIHHLKQMKDEIDVDIRVIVGRARATNQNDWQRFQNQDLTIFGIRSASMHHPLDGGNYIFHEDAPAEAARAIELFDDMWNAPYAQPVDRLLQGLPQFRLVFGSTA